MGRERPRPKAAAAAPRSPGGVAHAPHVRVDDVLRRVWEVPVQSRRERRSFSGRNFTKERTRIPCPTRRGFCLSRGHISADVRALLDAVNASTSTGTPVHETRGVQARIPSCA